MRTDRRVRTDLPHEDIVRRYKDGASLAALGREFGAHRKTIRTIIADAGLLRPSPRGGTPSRQAAVAKLLAEHGDEIVRLYRDELLSPEVIGKRWGLSGQTIVKHMDRQGVPIRNRREAQLVRRQREGTGRTARNPR